MMKPPKNTKGVAPQSPSRKPGGIKRGDVHSLVKEDGAKVDGGVYPEQHEPDTSDKVRGKDLDNAASGEGMNLDYPNTAVQDRYQAISPFRMRALGVRGGK